MLRVAIVGAGPSGIYALRELLRAEGPLAVTIFEAADRPGLGTPYDRKRNHPALLANIASFELPPVVDSLSGWLGGLAPGARAGLGVGVVSEREFYPRVALGGYFTAQYRKLTQSSDHEVDLRTRTKVVDVACLPDGVRVVHARAGETPAESRFDFAILCTGHRPDRKPRPFTSAAYPAPRLPADRPTRVGVLGASLSAIDAALALAWQGGQFVATPEGLVYRRRPGAPKLEIELLSRRGLLPETDFYFPYPYRPLRYGTPGAMRALAREPEGRLDLAFRLLQRDLAQEDPDYARRMGLADLDADSFADAYFRARADADPFAAARRNLAEARADTAARRVSGHRYALLRAHESFAELAPFFDKRDRERFRQGLQRVFADNYGATPPLSAERMLALRDAGALSMRRIAPGYVLRPGTRGKVEIADANGCEAYDLVVDALGEPEADARELPFPTLRLQALANQMMTRSGSDDLAIDEDFRLAPGVNPVGRVFCLAAPFLLSRRPFVQGLTCAEDMAVKAVARLLARAQEEPDATGAPLRTGALYLGGGLVVSTPT